MKTTRLRISLLLLLAISVSANASGLVVKETYHCEGMVYEKELQPNLYFECLVELQDSVVINIFDGNDIVAKGSLTGMILGAWSSSPHTSIDVVFPEPLILPRGKTYKIVFPADCMSKKDSASVTNDELVYEFTMAADFVASSRNFYDDEYYNLYGDQFYQMYGKREKVVCAREFQFFYYLDLDVAEGARGILLCGSDTVGTYPIKNQWGEVYESWPSIKLGEKMFFDPGKEYTIVLPTGSLLFRTDHALTNREESITFVGGYDGVHVPAKPFMSYDHGPDENGIYQVTYQYTEDVELADSAKIYLRWFTSGAFATEAPATIKKEDRGYYVTADFSHYPITSSPFPRAFLPQGSVYKALSGHRDVTGDDLTPKAITGRYDMLGRPVGPGYRGLTILKYTDGTAQRVIQR